MGHKVADRGAPERRPGGRVSGGPPANRVAEAVKPADLVASTEWGVRVMTPTRKEHGREQLRSIYGPASTTPDRSSGRAAETLAAR